MGDLDHPFRIPLRTSRCPSILLSFALYAQHLYTRNIVPRRPLSALPFCRSSMPIRPAPNQFLKACPSSSPTVPFGIVSFLPLPIAVKRIAISPNFSLLTYGYISYNSTPLLPRCGGIFYCCRITQSPRQSMSVEDFRSISRISSLLNGNPPCHAYQCGDMRYVSLNPHCSLAYYSLYIFCAIRILVCSILSNRFHYVCDYTVHYY